MANTVNAALKPLETLSRIVNQPSSLFGGKGSSSKSKTEHDTVGPARDSNSNTQDQGIHMSLIHSLDNLLPFYVCCWCVVSIPGESGEAEPVDGSHRVQGTDSDLMDGEAEGDTVVIAGQPEVLSTQAMQVRYRCNTHLYSFYSFLTSISLIYSHNKSGYVQRWMILFHCTSLTATPAPFWSLVNLYNFIYIIIIYHSRNHLRLN